MNLALLPAGSSTFEMNELLARLVEWKKASGRSDAS
jgi:hypothetical protein